MPPKRLRVLLSFTREPDESVVQTTRDAIAGLKDNNYFPHPPADPATLEAKLAEFIEAITAANHFLTARFYMHRSVYYHKTTFGFEEACRQLFRRLRDARSCPGCNDPRS